MAYFNMILLENTLKRTKKCEIEACLLPQKKRF